MVMPDLLPDEEVTVNLDFVAPEKLGKYFSSWKLSYFDKYANK